MEGMKEQKAYGQETSHEQIAKDENKGFSEKISDTAHAIGQKAAGMGQKVNETFSGLAGHEVGHYDSDKVFGSPALDGGFMPGRNLPEGKDLHAVGGIGESAKRELHESAVEKQQHAPEAISGLEQKGFGDKIGQTGFGDKIGQTGFGDNIQGQTGFGSGDKLQGQTGFGSGDKLYGQTGFGGDKLGQTGFGFGDKLQGQNDLGGFMPGRNLPEGQDLHMVGGIADSVKRELHDSAVDKQRHAPEAISGLEKDLDDMRLHNQTDMERSRGQEIKNEGGIIDSIKSKASDTAESVKETVVHAGQSAYNTTANALHVAKDKVLDVLPIAKDKVLDVGTIAKDKVLDVGAIAKDKVLDVGAKAKEMVVGATERSSERKGSVPDASLQFPSSQPNEGFPLDKGMLDKDKPFERGTLDQDKGLNKGLDAGLDAGLDKQKDGLQRNPQDGVWI